MRKICVVTGTRAEYGLLYWTIKYIQNSNGLSLQLCVTGMHLSPEFGLTYKQIEQDGFRIDKKVETLLSSDTSVGISKSIGLGMISFSEIFDELKPDIILVLGDRFEIFAAVAAAMISRIPVAHCHGGEATEGLIDESIRHSITKMSHLHFVATAEFANRVVQLGESPERVFNVGALGIESINKLSLLSKEDFERAIDFKLDAISFLVTFHPVTLEKSTAEDQFNNLLRAIEAYKNAKVIFTKPNADTDGRVIIHLIDEYVSKNPSRATSFISLGQLKYLSAIKHATIILGNSSSGLIEVPSFKKPTINIGDRQKGRVKAKSVIDCEPTTGEIIKAIDRALSNEFQEVVKSTENPYGNGNPSESIIQTLKKFPLENIIKKSFYNLQ